MARRRPLRTTLAFGLATAAVLLLPAIVLAQSGTPCPIGERCLRLWEVTHG